MSDALYTDREVAAHTGLDVTTRMEFAFGRVRRFHRIGKNAWIEYGRDLPQTGDGVMWWFGEEWGAPACHQLTRVPTPVREQCDLCHRPFAKGDRGFVLHSFWSDLAPKRAPVHFDCLLENLTGVAP